ncbi:hypothetical protein [Streptomyces sp. CAU 1734]|uniref:hypothetical protein n=1 Tax=Streptomyces sp. CAU 1734 TaxID=3140360 RepID=UPI0032615877
MRVRTSLTAAGLVTAAALALTGCGGDDAKDSAEKGKSSPAASQEKETGKDGAGGDMAGTWTGKTDGKSVTLAVTGTTAALLADKTACSGRVEDHGQQMLTMVCADGSKDRTMGTIESADGKTLVISWDKGARDTLTKAEAGDIPQLPDLPEMPDIKTELPTDLPEMPSLPAQ